MNCRQEQEQEQEQKEMQMTEDYGSVPRLFSWVVWRGDSEQLAKKVVGFSANERLIFGGEIPNMPSHCVLWNRDGRMFSGFHTGDFRELSLEET